ncbi:hypothetical protein [Streptomyces griseorubiginosus]|uniref:hypothetical protein n=1 Tax=Streptomyces griseorubiginosus TaxID=67304 RepID=UPI0036EA6DBA
MAVTPRTNTPDRKTTNNEGRAITTVTVKRACNGCGQYLGDATEAEIWRAVDGLPAEDVRTECEHCRPLVELEAAGCRTWQLTPRSYSRVAHEIDQLKPWVFTKGYFQTVEEELQVVGLRIGTGETRVVAYFGDWIIRHPDGGFTVHKAPAIEETTRG